MAEIFDPADLNKDGKVNFIDEEMAAVLAIKEANQAAKDIAIAEGQDQSRPGFTGLSGLAEEVLPTTPVKKRSSEAVELPSDPTSKLGIDLSTLDRAEQNRNQRFQDALGEDLIIERNQRQSTDSNN